MGKAAFPEMQRYKYRDSLAASCIAAGGTIATLIPPSASFIIYGILTEQSIGRLFLAGVLPGLLQTMIYITTIYVLCLRNPELGPAGPRTTFKEKVVSLQGGGPILALFLLVMGGIYMGIFTATEAGAIGAFGAFVIGFCMRRLSRRGIITSFLETGRIIAMVGVLIVGANVFSRFIAVTRITFILADFITGLQVSPWVVLAGVLVFYFVCGFFLSVISVLFLTLPLIFPLITALGFDPIWFGVLIVVMIEMGTITPPVAQVCFVLSGVIKVPIGTIFRGIFPFILADIVVLAVLIAFPQVSLWLPTTMKG
jgi:tripartite ATP-independent transporter DctM subunit